MVRVYRNENNRWVLERDNGEVIELSWAESSLLYDKIRDSVVWDEVDMRIESDDDYRISRGKIEVAKDEIISKLRDYADEITGDDVYDVVNRYVDL